MLIAVFIYSEHLLYISILTYSGRWFYFYFYFFAFWWRYRVWKFGLRNPGKKLPKVKLQRLWEIRIWTFGSLVHQSNSFWEVLKLDQIFQKSKVVTRKTPVFVIGPFCSRHSICLKGTLIQIWKFANIFVFAWKWHVENFILKHLLRFEICTCEICEKFVYKHSETIE